MDMTPTATQALLIRKSPVTGKWDALRFIGATGMAETITSFHETPEAAEVVLTRMVEVGMLAAGTEWMVAK